MPQFVAASEVFVMEKLAVLVKKEVLSAPLLHVLLKLFVVRIVNWRFLRIFGGVKAFVLEHTYTPSNI